VQVEVYLFRYQQAKHATQQRNKFHKGSQPKEQMSIMLAIYITSRIIVSVESSTFKKVFQLQYTNYILKSNFYYFFLLLWQPKPKCKIKKTFSESN